MGAWGTGPFENDDAMDFVPELEAGGVSALRQAVEEVTLVAPDEYLEAPSAARAIAAVEVVAATLQRAATDLPPEVLDWVATAQGAEQSLVGLSREAVDRVPSRSEPKDLWEEVLMARPGNIASRILESAWHRRAGCSG